MKLTTTVCFALCLWFQGAAQGLKQGKEVFYPEGKIRTVKFWEITEHGAITKYQVDNKMVFVKHDLTSLNKIAQARINFDKPDSKDGYVFWSTWSAGNTLWVFATHNDKKQDKKGFYVTGVDLKSMEQIGGFKKILEVDVSKELGAGYFQIGLSPDDSKCLIMVHQPQEGKALKTIDLHVFDEGLNPIWHRKMITNSAKELAYYNNYFLTNEGDLHIVGWEYNKKVKEVASGKPNYQMAIYSTYSNGKEYKQAKFATLNFLKQTYMFLEGEQFVFYGYYNTIPKDDANGQYNLVFDLAKGQLVTEVYNPFAKDLIPEGEKDNISNLRLRFLYKLEDGSWLMAGEQYKVIVGRNVSTSGDIRTVTSTYRYNVQDLIFHHLNADFTVKKAWRYEKKQKSVDDDGDKLSIKAVQQDGKVIILLNEMDANTEDKDKTFHAGLAHKSSVSAIIIDAAGNQTKKIVETEVIMSQDFTRVHNGVMYRLLRTETGYNIVSRKLPAM